LSEATSYAVQSSVPREIFRAFVDWLKTESEISVTKGNALSLWFLAKEFFLSDLADNCASLSVPVDQVAGLWERVSDLERQIPLSNQPGKLEEVIEAQEEGLESLRLALDRFKASVGGELNQLKSGVERSPDADREENERNPTSKCAKAPVSPGQRPGNRVEIPINTASSLDGIISYLTKKHGGNVHEKGIVILTSKSIRYVTEDGPPLATVVDHTSGWAFQSEDEPGQWICWDFCEMRVFPTHYTIWARCLRSWFVEGSLDGSRWTEIDRQPDHEDLKGKTASFAVSNAAEFRFIRLTQTGRNYYRTDVLSLCAVEFAGTLYE
jgi:hypothetical protein